MSDRTYYRVSPAMWHPKRRHWTDDMRLLAMYLLTSPHRITEGLFYLPLGYIETDLGWVPDRVSDRVYDRVSHTLSRLEAEGFVKYDTRAQVVFIVNALAYQAPSGWKQVKGAVRALKDLPDTPLFKDLHEKAIGYAIDYAKGLEEEYPIRFTKDYTIYSLTPSPSPSPQPSAGILSLSRQPPPTKGKKKPPALDDETSGALLAAYRGVHPHVICRAIPPDAIECIKRHGGTEYEVTPERLALVAAWTLTWKGMDPTKPPKPGNLLRATRWGNYVVEAEEWNEAGRPSPPRPGDRQPSEPSWAEEYNVTD